MMAGLFLQLAVFVSTTAPLVLANQYDPHAYPSRGLFMEGWYSRITDTTSPLSFGVVFGRVLPVAASEEHGPTAPLTYLAIIRSDGTAAAPFVVAEAYPDPDDILVTVGGDDRPVTGNPDDRSPAHFTWAAEPYGSFAVTPTTTVFNFTIRGQSLSGSFGPPVPWGPGGKGPEGWLSNLPLVPLHWFVYSLATVGTYTWADRQTGLRIHGNGTMHQEKNWGGAFPPSWIWMQGADSSASAAFAGAFGTLDFSGLQIPAHLFGFRDFGRADDISVDFRPDNSVARVNATGCAGAVSIEVTSFWYKVVLRARAPPATLQRCLRGPTGDGFRPVLVESYVATVSVSVYQRHYFGYQLVDSKLFEGAALEFGGGQLCSQNPCNTEL